MNAIEVTKPVMTTFHSRPVFSQGIMQRSLHRLTVPCDARIGGLMIRLPADTVLSLTSGGVDGIGGSLMVDVDFRGLDGQVYRATRGMAVRVAGGITPNRDGG